MKCVFTSNIHQICSNSIPNLLHPVVIALPAGAQARYGGSLQSEEVSVEGSSESSLTGLVPNDTLFPAEGAHCTASTSELCGYLTYMTQTS